MLGSDTIRDDELSVVFKALGHPIRRTILDLLRAGPRKTGELVEKFPEVSRYAIMKHLSALEEADLILLRREGRTRLNYINAIPLQQIYDRWVSRYQSTLASSLTVFRQNLERGTNDMSHTKEFQQDSFQIEQEIVIEASRPKVFESLTKDINQWWAYRLCGQDSILSFEPKVGGRFVEDAGNGNGALWGVVTYINAPEEICLNGLLGMRGAVNSSYTYKLEEKGSSTILKLSHRATGLLDPDWEQSHSEGWKELLGQFLKEYVEKGKLPNQGK
jgi:DNA-binding transcriptional ArsR family regulator/uncharacterized protein YndB with AHSA1/START domain